MSNPELSLADTQEDEPKEELNESIFDEFQRARNEFEELSESVASQLLPKPPAEGFTPQASPQEPPVFPPLSPPGPTFPFSSPLPVAEGGEGEADGRSIQISPHRQPQPRSPSDGLRSSEPKKLDDRGGGPSQPEPESDSFDSSSSSEDLFPMTGWGAQKKKASNDPLSFAAGLDSGFD